METNAHEPKYPVQTLERALQIIEILFQDMSNKGLGISELSRRMDIGKSTVHRILDTLMSYRYVEKTSENKYRLSWRLFEIGSIVPKQHNLYDFDMQIIRELCSKHGESVNLAIQDKNECVIISRFDSEENLRGSLQVGGREPLHATAIGKILISEMQETEIIELLGSSNYKRFTPNTITTMEALGRELQKIRNQGFAVDDEEYCMGLRCIAMPVRNYKNNIIAAVSVSGPAIRMSFTKIMDVKDDLQETCLKLSDFFGVRREKLLVKKGGNI